MTSASSAAINDGAISYERVSEYESDGLAYIVEVERWEDDAGPGRERSFGELRVTSVLVPEDGTWKVLHRHADPIPRAAPL